MFRSKLMMGVLIAVSLSTPAWPAETTADGDSLKTFGDWVVACGTLPDGKGEKCFVSQLISQNTNQKDGGTPVAKFSIGHIGPNGELVAMATVPLGLLIPAGVSLRVDEKNSVPLIVQTCKEEGCIAAGKVDDAILSQISDAKQVLLTMQMVGEPKPVAIPLSTKGFKEAYSALK